MGEKGKLFKEAMEEPRVGVTCPGDSVGTDPLLGKDSPLGTP